MTDGQLLLAVFIGFYVLECLHWLPLSSTVFHTWAVRRGWSVRTPLPMLAAPGKGVVITWPLPPLGGFLAADGWSILPDEQGLWTTLDPVRRVRWDELAPQAEAAKVQLTKTVAVSCASPRASKRLFTFLKEVQAAQGEERRHLIEAWWESSISLPRARAAVRRYRLAASLLRWPCTLVFAICFASLPYLFWYRGGGVEVLPAFASLLLTNGLVAFTWRWLDRRLYPQEKRLRWPQVLHLIVMPAHTMRAHDLLGLDLLAGVHPLAAAGSLLPRPQLAAYASELWRRWHFMGPQDPLAGAAPQVLPCLERLCQRLKLDKAELETVPARQPNTESYCPRCLAQFQRTGAKCKDCNGTETVVW